MFFLDIISKTRNENKQNLPVRFFEYLLDNKHKIH